MIMMCFMLTLWARFFAMDNVSSFSIECSLVKLQACTYLTPDEFEAFVLVLREYGFNSNFH